jgi:hypothetical protein
MHVHVPAARVSGAVGAADSSSATRAGAPARPRSPLGPYTRISIGAGASSHRPTPYVSLRARVCACTCIFHKSADMGLCAGVSPVTTFIADGGGRKALHGGSDAGAGPLGAWVECGLPRRGRVQLPPHVRRQVARVHVHRRRRTVPPVQGRQRVQRQRHVGHRCDPHPHVRARVCVRECVGYGVHVHAAVPSRFVPAAAVLVL